MRDQCTNIEAFFVLTIAVVDIVFTVLLSMNVMKYMHSTISIVTVVIMQMKFSIPAASTDGIFINIINLINIDEFNNYHFGVC